MLVTTPRPLLPSFPPARDRRLTGPIDREEGKGTGMSKQQADGNGKNAMGRMGTGNHEG